MPKITCECGQSFSAEFINSTPRTHCPFCRRAIRPSEASTATAGSTDRASPPPPVAITPGLYEGPSTFGAILAKQLAAREKAHQARFDSSSPTNPAKVAPADADVNPQATPSRASPSALQADASNTTLIHRFGNPGVTEFALRELHKFLEAKLRGTTEPRCARDPSCKPLQCRRAFACGALPCAGNGARFILGWTGAFAAGCILLMAIAFLPFYFLALHEPGEAVPWLVLTGAVFLPGIIVGAIVLVFAAIASQWQQRHLRALAVAAQQSGLRFTGRLTVPVNPCGPAIPIIVPGTAFLEPPFNDMELTIDVVISGKSDGHQLHVVRYESMVDPMDYVAGGTAVKVVSALVQPKLAFSRESQKQWWGYLVASFPDPLSHVPDFLLAPRKSAEGCLIQRWLSDQVLRLPGDGHLASYIAAAAEGEAVATWLAGEPLLRLAAMPEWSVQVVGGRLSVWRGRYYPMFRHTLPRDAASIEDLIRFATELRQVLVRHGLTRGMPQSPQRA